LSARPTFAKLGRVPSLGQRDPWQRVLDPRFPWIRSFYTAPERGYPGHVLDLRTREQAWVSTETELFAFIGRHSAAPGLGLGNAVRALTKRLGFGECTPCAKRQAALNQAASRLFRR
jgi:hypothetical protein